MNGPKIHWCDHARQPNIHLVCTDTWTTPKWGTPAEKATGLKGVHMADTGDLYTFRADLVTCIACDLLADHASKGGS
jgi:hypothetical protein